MSFLRSLRSNQAGFSLLEVLITASIIGIISAIVVVKYGSFNSAVLLKNQAYELALDIREAQILAVSVRGDATGSEFRSAYGVHLNINPSQPNYRKQYIIFQDITSVPWHVVFDNGEGLGSGPNGQTYFDSRFEIADLCVNIYSATPDCGVYPVDISFKRPNFDATIRAVLRPSGTVIDASDVRIRLRNVSDPTSMVDVIVTATGQISVE